jgi:hypothetical protein
MLKASFVAAFLTTMAFSPAFAAQDLCNDAHMKQMDDMIAKMTDAKKKEATMHLDMSKAGSGARPQARRETDPGGFPPARR